MSRNRVSIRILAGAVAAAVLLPADAMAQRPAPAGPAIGARPAVPGGAGFRPGAGFGRIGAPFRGGAFHGRIHGYSGIYGYPAGFYPWSTLGWADDFYGWPYPRYSYYEPSCGYERLPYGVGKTIRWRRVYRCH